MRKCPGSSLSAFSAAGLKFKAVVFSDSGFRMLFCVGPGFRSVIFVELKKAKWEGQAADCFEMHRLCQVRFFRNLLRRVLKGCEFRASRLVQSIFNP